MSAYYASISFMDAQVGVLLDALDRLQSSKHNTTLAELKQTLAAGWKAALPE